MMKSTKTKVLDLLIRNDGEYLSGEFIAKKSGVSRNAVWKAITSLREEGYGISSKTNCGYMLNRDDILTPEIISAYLTRKTEVICLDVVDSTNNEAKRRLAAGLTTPLLITAKEQTGGRGRQGKSFLSPRGGGVYMSLVLHPEISADLALSYTCAASVAVCRAIKKLTGKDTEIKWVNDVYLNGRKLCGILTEAITDFETGITHSVIIGIGINMKSEALPPEISDIATALDCDGITVGELVAAVADEISFIVSDISNKEYMTEYRKRSMVLGKEISYIRNGVSYSGKVTGISDTGSLTVMNGEKEEILSSGEITLRLKG